MWVLIISLYALEPLGHVQSRGIIHVPQPNLEQCYQSRDTVNRTWHIDQYKTSARCIWVKHYSTNNGAYHK